MDKMRTHRKITDFSVGENKTGLWIVFVKIAPKLSTIFVKLLKFLPKTLKGLFSIKAAGAVASLGLYSFLFSWQMGVSLVAFILIHEYGHLRAMKRCGIRTRGIYLIPGFGGAAMADEAFHSSGNEAYISIMGPLYGLFFIGPMILLYFITHNPLYAAIASIMSFINLFNLFPINPLDGGRITKSFLYSFHDSLGFFFMLASIALAVFLSWYARFLLLLYVVMIGLYETITDYGLRDALAKFVKTILRGFGMFLLFHYYPAFFEKSVIDSVWQSFFILIFGVCLIAAFFYDIMSSTKEAQYSFLAYPFIVIGDVFRGIGELFSIKPSDLKRIDQHEPMNRKQLVLYGILYVLTIIAMVALVVYTGSIPGAHHAKEMLA